MSPMLELSGEMPLLKLVSTAIGTAQFRRKTQSSVCCSGYPYFMVDLSQNHRLEESRAVLTGAFRSAPHSA